MIIRSAWLGLFCLAGFACAQNPAPRAAEPSTKQFQYECEGVALDGLLVWDGAKSGQRPAVIIADVDTSAARARADHFAKLGYVAFVADLWGNSGSPKENPELKHRNRIKRLDAAVDALAKQPLIAPHKIAAVGYGFAATALLDLARTDADLVGIACMHGDWSSTAPGKIKCRVLAIMGADDPNSSTANLAVFENQMKAICADWDIIRYGGVGGGFTYAPTHNDPKGGSGYDIDADQRAHAAVTQFLAELFPTQRPRSFAPAQKDAPKPAAPKGVPESALKVLQYVDDHDRAMDGYEGGRNFGNFERRLPTSDRNGRRIRYQEWDVNPLRPGVNRGPQRVVTGSDGSAHYTDDHYSTFKKIR